MTEKKIKALEERIDQLETLYLTQSQQIDTIRQDVTKLAEAIGDLCEVLKGIVDKLP